MTTPQPRLSHTEHQLIMQFVHHMIQCGTCTRAQGTQATFYGCMTGHLTAVRAANCLRRFYPLPVPAPTPDQEPMF